MNPVGGEVLDFPLAGSGGALKSSGSFTEALLALGSRGPERGGNERRAEERKERKKTRTQMWGFELWLKIGVSGVLELWNPAPGGLGLVEWTLGCKRGFEGSAGEEWGSGICDMSRGWGDNLRVGV